MNIASSLLSSCFKCMIKCIFYSLLQVSANLKLDETLEVKKNLVSESIDIN